MDPQNNSDQQNNANSLWGNVRAKKERMESGSGERKAQKGDADYPKADAFKKASKKK